MSSCGCKKSFFGGKKRKNKTKRKYRKKSKKQQRKTLKKNNKNNKNNVTMKSFSYQKKQGFLETNGKRDYFYFEKVGNKKPIFFRKQVTLKNSNHKKYNGAKTIPVYINTMNTSLI